MDPSAPAARRWAAGLAASALLGFVGADALLLSNAIMLPGAGYARTVLAVFIGPLALSLSAVILLRGAGRLSAPAALCTAASAVPAFGFAALAAASFSVGFEEADAGLGRSWLGASSLLFFLIAWTAGTISLVAPVESVMRQRRTLAMRLVLSTALAALLALVLGALMLTAPLIGTMGAAVLLVLALRPSGEVYPPIRRATLQAVRSSVPKPAAGWTRRRAAVAGAAALVTVIVGLGCVVFALTGSNWAPAVNDPTRAMNIGLAAGALAAVPAALAAGMVLAPRFGSVMRGSALLCCAALIVVSAAQFLGAAHPAQWPLILAAATLAGFAVALPFGRLIPGGRGLRLGLTAVFGFAGSTLGLGLVTMAAFIAPPAAAALFIWSLTRRAGPHGQPGPPLITSQGG